MPRKNKKKQRKEERRKAMQRVRQQKGWEPPPDIEFVDDELTRDLLTFIPELGGDEEPGVAVAETLTDAVLDSYELADEPEFAEIYFHPMQAIDVYGELEEERGITEEMLDALSEDEEDELFFDLMTEIARRALTVEMQDVILDALETLWKRVRLAGDQEKAGRLAGMMLMLGSEDGEEVWPEVGLVQALLRRSLDAGFELLSVMQSAGVENLGVHALVQTGREDSVQRQVQTILSKYPGLESVLTQVDEAAWQRGLTALMDGELYLGLFSQEELEQAADLVTPAAEDAQEVDTEHVRANVRAVQAYINGLLTSERRAEMREQLLTMLEDDELAGEWHSFLLMILYDLDDDDPQTAMVFLTAAFIGEMADMAGIQDYMEVDDEAQD